MEKTGKLLGTALEHIHRRLEKEISGREGREKWWEGSNQQKL